MELRSSLPVLGQWIDPNDEAEIDQPVLFIISEKGTSLFLQLHLLFQRSLGNKNWTCLSEVSDLVQ